MASSTKTVPNLLPPIPGIIELHQLKTVDRLKLSHRDVGCACDSELKCDWFKWFSFLFPDKKTQDSTEQENIELPERTATRCKPLRLRFDLQLAANPYG